MFDDRSTTIRRIIDEASPPSRARALEQGNEGAREQGSGVPQTPRGLSEGELRFVPMLEVLKASGKVADGVSELDLAHYWRSVEPGSDPRDRDWLEDLRAKLSGHAGRVGSLDPWLRRRAYEFFGQKKSAGPVQVGPPVEAM